MGDGDRPTVCEYVDVLGNPRVVVSSVVVPLLAVVVGCVGALVGVTPARAADTIDTYTAQTRVRPDGTLEVRATITPAPGVEQVKQTFTLAEELPGLRTRVYAVEEVAVTSGGEPAGDVTGRRGDTLTVTMRARGDQPIELAYVVRGASVREGSGATLVHWNVVQGLSAEVRAATGTLLLPGEFQSFDCNAGQPGGARSCRSAQAFAQVTPLPQFTDGPLAPGEVLGFQMLFDAGVVAPNENVDEQWTVGRAFTATGWPLAVAAAVLLLGLLGLWALHRRGGVDAAPDGKAERIAEFRPVGEGESEFVLRSPVRPGQVGTLVDERVDPVDVTASIIDLAVRGHLRIRELPREGRFSGGDWEIQRRDDADDDLLPYEAALRDALVPGAEPTRVSQIAQMAEGMPRVQSLLYDEMVRNGWYARRPDATRSRWGVAAIALVVVGVVGTIALAALTRWALTGVAVILLGLGLLYVATEMPARTSRGARILQGLAMLSNDLRSHDTDEMPAGRAYEQLSAVLPYAIVLGGRARWLKALVAADDDADADPTDLDWYHAPQDWHLRDLPDSLQNLIIHLEGELFSR